MIKNIFSPESEVRERTADATTDLTSSYSEEQAQTLVRALAAAAALEDNHKTLESQLHAISELDVTGLSQPDDFFHLKKIDRHLLPEQLEEYLRDLFED
ncbi:hypothetical protein [Streptomyces qinglanensis]|uniref:hypothetical protein n=1 Tax=Streptomyces qinglanensis TaxID=943816 RepID=UPI003D72078F